MTDLAIGDHVVISWIPTCGKCRYCVMGKPQLCDMSAKATITLPDGTSRYKDSKGQTLNHFAGTGVMTEYATLTRDNVIKIDPSIGMDKAAIVGCAVMTGAGAAINTAKVEPGSTCVVFGAGGVGLNTIQGCAISGAHRSSRSTRRTRSSSSLAFGATDTINPDHRRRRSRQRSAMMTWRRRRLRLRVHRLRGRAIQQAYNCIRRQGRHGGGRRRLEADRAVTLGASPDAVPEKTLTGSMYGGAAVDRLPAAARTRKSAA